MIKFPVRVLLRNKLQATINDAIFTGNAMAGFGDKAPMDDVFLCGITEDGYQRWFDMWRLDGKWRYNAQPHAYDIVGIEEGSGFRPLTDDFKA